MSRRNMMQLQKDLAYWRRVSHLRILDAKAARERGSDIGMSLCLGLARSYSRNAQKALRDIRATGAPVQVSLLEEIPT